MCRALLVGLVVVGATGAGRAAAAQSAPSPEGRRAVRGCPIDRECSPNDVLHQFELEAFPPAGDGPWIGDKPRMREPTPRVSRASQLRPDLPWLDELELPDLPVRWTPKLIEYLVFYKDDPRGHAIMKGWLADQGRYRDLILGHLRKARLPEDLLYVAMIESGYSPVDSSHAGAAGLWQFMPEGGKIYGLRIDRWVDERNDPVRSTRAVLDYFRDLHQRFGDWHLALAAFNAGYGAVLRSVARYNTNDYWKLVEIENGLPWESSLYVPKALAAAICGRNRDKLGFGDVKPVAPERWDDVTVPSSVTLGALARAIGVAVDEVRRLNPHLRRGRTPPGDAGYVVRVPRGKGELAAKKLADLKSDWDGYDAYVMQHGERFEDVATTFGIAPVKLRQLNEIAHESEVGGGTVLVVPRIAADERERNRAKAIANLHASGIDQKAGEPLLVAVPDKDAVVAGKRRVFYRVVIGDALEEIARVLGVTSQELAVWNDIAVDGALHPRMVLLAWVAPAFDAARANVRLLDADKLLVVTRGSREHLDHAEARVGRTRMEYSPKKPESLEAIGKKFGLGPRDLARINKIKSTAVIQPGQTIVVYKVVDRTRSDRAEEQWQKTPRTTRRTPSSATKPTPAPPEPRSSDPMPPERVDDAAPRGGGPVRDPDDIVDEDPGRPRSSP